MTLSTQVFVAAIIAAAVWLVAHSAVAIGITLFQSVR